MTTIVNNKTARRSGNLRETQDLKTSRSSWQTPDCRSQGNHSQDRFVEQDIPAESILDGARPDLARDGNVGMILSPHDLHPLFRDDA